MGAQRAVEVAKEGSHYRVTTICQSLPDAMATVDKILHSAQPEAFRPHEPVPLSALRGTEYAAETLSPPELTPEQEALLAVTNPPQPEEVLKNGEAHREPVE